MPEGYCHPNVFMQTMHVILIVFFTYCVYFVYFERVACVIVIPLRATAHHIVDFILGEI